MADKRLFVIFVFITLSLTKSASSYSYAKLNYPQNRDIDKKIDQLMQVRYSTTKPTEDQKLAALSEAYDREIKRLEYETGVKLNSLDQQQIIVETIKQIRGKTDPILIENVTKGLQMMALKFHERDEKNQPNADEIFEAINTILDREIEHLTNAAPAISRFTIFGYTSAAVVLIVANRITGI